MLECTIIRELETFRPGRKDLRETNKQEKNSYFAKSMFPTNPVTDYLMNIQRLIWQMPKAEYDSIFYVAIVSPLI